MAFYQRSLLFTLFCFTICCLGAPVSDDLVEVSTINSLPGYLIIIVSLAVIILVSYLVVGCVCCPNKSIKALTYQNGFPVNRLNENNSLQFENPSEFAIFPPQSAVIDLQPVGLSYPAFEDKVTFEPLPDILPRRLSGQSAACSSRPAHFRALLKNKVSLHDWFDDPNSNFPRDQLQYLKELGCGWFGQVVEGEAAHICNAEEKTSVVVKILREEASPSEHLHFLHEARPYRNLSHPNVIRLLGRCLESDPFLLLMEHSTSDLKSYLSQQENRDILIRNGIQLQMACNVSSGLKCLHDNGFIHTDFAAHNCFVSSDLTVKVGDYGISFDQCREDYYCIGETALPIRWCSPETLICTDSTIETKEITKEANVWAFGVVLWEIFEFGKLPYESLTNEEVLQKVLIERNVQLPTLSVDIPIKEELSLIMRECWKVSKLRPSMGKMEQYLSRMYNDRHNLKTLETSFEERWNAIQPKIKEVKSASISDPSSLKFENDFSERSDSHNLSYEGERFSSFEMSFDMYSKNISSQLSPSLRVLNGSMDELTENDVCLNSVSLEVERSTVDAISFASVDDLPQLEEESVCDRISTSGKLDFHVSAEQQCSQVNNDVVGIKNNNYLLEKNMQVKSSSSSNSEVNLNEALDDNSNVLPETDMCMESKSVNVGLVNQEISEDVLNLEMTKPSLNTDESYIADSVAVTSTVSDVNLALKEENSDVINHNRSSSRCSIPNIVVQEPPFVPVDVEDVSEEDSKNNFGETTTKPFRFVFKEETVDNNIYTGPTIVSSGSGSSNTPSSHDTLNVKGRSQPLTSTPLKGSHDVDLNYSEEFSSFLEKDDSSSVFYSNFVPESNEQNVLSKSHNTLSSKLLESNTEGDVFTSLINVSEPLKLENNETHSKLNSHNEDEWSCDPNQYATAHSTFNINSNAISKTILVENNESNLTNCVNDLTAEVKRDIFAAENDCAFPSVKAKVLDGNDKCANLDIHFSTEVLNEDGSAQKSPSTFQELSLEFGESATPDVSINISGFSNENEGKSLDTSSPGILSDNIKDTESDLDSSYSKEINQDINGAFNQTRSLNLTYDSHINTSRNFESEASGSEFIDSYSPDVTSNSFTEENRMEAAGNMRMKKSVYSSNHLTLHSENKTDLFYSEDDLDDDSESDTNASKSKGKLRSYDELIVEDLETGEQTIITESFSACDDYENSAESDEILKINTETDEAIIVDSSQALIGFVPSRSIEMLNECEMIATMNPTFGMEDDKEFSDLNNYDPSNSPTSSPGGNQSNESPYNSPDTTYPLHQSYRNFNLQNEIIEEEVTGEIATPSSDRSTSSFSSNELYMGEEKMSQSSESNPQDVSEVSPQSSASYEVRQEDLCETSVLPSMDHLYGVSDEDCSPIRVDRNGIENNRNLVKDLENNHLVKDDVMYCRQPMQSVRWHSDDTLDVERESPIILEGREILAGEVLETKGMSVEDITTALNRLEVQDRLNRKSLDHLGISRTPSPYSSLESSPCREAYTPDFESEDSASGTSCSSTSGSFECIHNKFKDSADITKLSDGSDDSNNGKEQSPLKIFSKTWDCHATPTKGVLVSPEKKFSSLRKSVSFHNEDPQVVFEYPPASDSSEDGGENDEVVSWDIDYRNYADWELQAGDNEEIEEVLEIEELDSEPYVRRPHNCLSFSQTPLNRPMMYSLTTGFSDDDMDFSEPLTAPSTSPSNSPEEGKQSMIPDDQIGDLIRNQLNNLALEESRLMRVKDVIENQTSENKPIDFTSNHQDLAEQLLLKNSEIKDDHNDNQDLNFKNTQQTFNNGEVAIPSTFTDFKTQIEKDILPEKSFNNDSSSVAFKQITGVSNNIEKLFEASEIYSNVNTDSEAFKTSNFNSNLSLTAPYIDKENETTESKNVSDIDVVLKDNILTEGIYSGTPFDFLSSRISNTSDSIHTELNLVSELPIRDINTQKENETLISLNNSTNDLDKVVPLTLEEVNNSKLMQEEAGFVDIDLNSIVFEDLSNWSISTTSSETSAVTPEVSAVAPDISRITIETTVKTSLRTSETSVVDAESTPETSVIASEQLTLATNCVDDSLESNEGKVINGKICDELTSLDNSSEIITGGYFKDCRSENVEAEVNPGDNLFCNINDELLKTFSSSFQNSVNDGSCAKIETPSNTDIAIDKTKDFESAINSESKEEVNLNSCSPTITEAALEIHKQQTKNPVDITLEFSSGNIKNKVFSVDSSLNFQTIEEKYNNVISDSGNVNDVSNPLKSEDIEYSHKSAIAVEATSEASDYTKISNCISGLNEGLTEKVHTCNGILNSVGDNIEVSSHDESALKNVQDDAFNGAKPKVKTASKESNSQPPQIIVTPANESDIEDELEEYLRNQLRFGHSPEATGGDFSASPNFSYRSFEDVYTNPGISRDYTEAFNFEFDSGEFFDDVLGNYQSDNKKNWESSNLPPMLEKSSDDDEFLTKVDSSPPNFASKDTTHL